MVASCLQPEVEVVVQDYTGNVIPIASVEGSLSKGSKGNTKAIKFTSDKPGSYKASLTGLDVFLGTYEYAIAPPSAHITPPCSNIKIGQFMFFPTFAVSECWSRSCS